VHLTSGAGSLRYQGTPSGSSGFQSGAGSITLVLPADLDVAVDLETELGTVDVDHGVAGRVTRRQARGTIGSGDQGQITARSGVGSIRLILR
jgi:hypothetical protein